MKVKFKFNVSFDNMQATVLIGRPNEEYVVGLDEILEALKAEGIVYGIQEDKLQFAVDHQSFMSEILCAKGKSPVNGKDGELKFAVPLHTELRPKIRDDGTADYHDLGLINEISEGRLLCRRTRPIPGVDGVNVYGQSVPFVPGLYPEFPAGVGTEISKIDDTKLVAAQNGYVKFENDIISVPNTFVLNSDVNNSTGDIKYKGDIIINGSVREGFRVVTDASVTINGTCEGANVVAGGNVNISDGCMGMSDGKILSGGNVKVRYLQNMIVKCAGKIETEYSLNSYLNAGSEVYAQEGRGTIAGGEVHSCGSIFAKNIGSETYICTKIVIDDMPVRFWDENFNAYNYVPDDEDEMLEEQPIMPMIDNSKVAVHNCIYPGSKLQIGMLFYDVTDEIRASKFLMQDGEITPTPIF